MSSYRAEEVVAFLDNVPTADHSADPSSQGDRVAVVEAARRLLARFETPFERAWRLSWINSSVHMAVQVVLDLGIWEAWHKTRRSEMGLSELHALSGTPCDLALLRRLFRLLAVENVVREIDEDLYAATAFSEALGQTTEPVAQTILSGTHHGLESCRNLPQFLSRTGYVEPLDPKHTSYMELTPERLGMFERCGMNPDYQTSFIGLMQGLATYKLDWTEIYDTSLLVNDFDANGKTPLLVDVGGAHGVDIERLSDRYPDLPAGKLILQDTLDVIRMAKVSEKITAIDYDFFTSQPIKGARAYFMHAIIHDWNDIDAGRILKNVAEAMEKGYSKLLLYEGVLARTGATLYQSLADVSVMHLVSGGERTEVRWRDLLRTAGFEICKIWRHPASLESVIEAELV